jgi:hypothetical protein
MARWRVCTVFLGLSMVAMFTTEANAGCITLSSGGRYCAAWITGSEICNLTIQGVTPDAETFVLCTVDVPFGESGIPGTAFCLPDGTDTISSAKTSANDVCRHHFSGVGTGHTSSPGRGHVDDCQSVPLTLTSANTTLPLSSAAVVPQCDAKGVCKATLEVDPETCTNCCPLGTTFVTFTADRFHARAELLHGACDEVEGTCALIGVVDEQCSLTSGGHRYDCVASPPLED